MTIRLGKASKDQCYFIAFAKFTVCTSRGFSILLNIDIDLFNNLLITKVIKHSSYTMYKNHKDVEFILNDTPEETCINRFKEIFINELTLLAIGGVQ